MSEGLAAVLMLATLRRREHERAVLDRARPVEHMPVRFAGLFRECRWNGQEYASGMRECAMERGKAQIVADGQAQPSPRQVGGDGDLARPIASRFAIALAARKVHVEHVYLVVARDNFAFGVDEKGPVRCLFLGELDCKRPDVN